MSQDITKYSLNGDEMGVLNPDAKILKYTQLDDYNNIEEIFSDCNKVIILYLLQSDWQGHWVCLFKNIRGIHFFDSYGHPYDYEIERLSPEKRKQLDEEKSQLKILLKDKNVDYSFVKYQDNDTNTCGCFVSHRLNNYKIDNRDYLNLFLKNDVSNPDLFVAKYCFNKLKYL